MIKIRYRDSNELSPGLFAAAESHGRGTTVYLLSGLTPAERQAALRRLRLSARMGHGIRLPAAQLGLALVADGVRTAFGRAGAVFRSHPAGSTVPVMVVSAGAIAFLLLSAVSIRVLHPAPPLNQLPPSFPAPSVSVIAEPVTNVPPTPGAGGLGPRDIGTATRGTIGTDRWTVFSPGIGSFGTGSRPGGGTADGSGTTNSDTAINGSGSGTGSTTGTGGGSTGTGSGGTGTGTGSGGGTPTPTPSMTSSPTPSPSPSPRRPRLRPRPRPRRPPRPRPTGTGGDGNCLDVGPVGVCLDV